MTESFLHHNRGRILAYLIRVTGDFADAEDLCQEVMIAALTAWQAQGMPGQPLAWLYRVARNKVVDRVRRRVTEEDYLASVHEDQQADFDPERLLEDDMLRLIFTCCHPALAPEVRVPLTLRLIAGFSNEEVARAFVTTPAAMEQRLTRAKRKIKAAGISYEIPTGSQLEVRLESVLQTLYLMFNEGYSATRGDQLLRESVCSDAIRLCTLVQRLFPERAELLALLALMLLQHSRRRARVSNGELVLLDQQDRSLWEHAEIQRGRALLDKALQLKQPAGPYQLQAAIAALHCEDGARNWHEITLLYRRLLTIDYSPVAHLNYAVALSLVPRLDDALNELEQIEATLERYQPFYCARADMLRRSGELQRALDDYQTALQLSENAVERAFVEAQVTAMSAG